MKTSRLTRCAQVAVLAFIGVPMLLIPAGLWASSTARANAAHAERAPAGSAPAPTIPPARYGAVIPADWDMNGDGVLDYTDIDARAGELAGMTSYIRLHGGCVAIDTALRPASEACSGR